jgi:hypothetical protein
MPVIVSSEDMPKTFSTWEGFEPDKCASIWLIKRFINKDAEFKFFPKGEFIKEGIPFDTPDARLRRYHDRSTYESIIKEYKIDDPAARQIGMIIHDIEINIWEKKLYKESLEVDEKIMHIIQNSKDNAEIIQKSDAYFDFLYKDINKD